MNQASKMDAGGTQADMVKTIENYWFSEVFEGWGLFLEAWKCSGLNFWHPGWQMDGWLEGWLVVAGMLAGGWAGRRDS
jgi:hypothetical protein